MPSRASVPRGGVCSPAAARLNWVLALLTCIAAPTGGAAASTVKVAFYNIQSGKGEPGLPGRPVPFADTVNCTDATKPLNAWGVGFVQQELLQQIASDPSIVALGLAEAWAGVCASPENVRAVLGWKSRSQERNGLAVVARHGFSGGVTFLQLDTSQSTNTEPRYIAHASVCLDAACSATFDVFVTHMAASGSLATESMVTQVQQAVGFMHQQAGSRPRALLGDLNVYEEMGPACGDSPSPTRILDQLRNAAYVDTWRAIHGTQTGYTGMVNRAGCGLNDGAPYKRIDYAWSHGIAPTSIEQFGVVLPVGDAAPSDHYGLVAEYSPTSATLTDASGPSVSLNAPASGATVSGVVEVSASASDAQGLARVEFFADGVAIGADLSAPYAVSWDTRALMNGSHTLQARAVDTLGNASVTPLRTVNVANSTATTGAIDEVVLYASTASIAGTLWQIGDDAGAASGRRLFNANLGAPKPGASASPSDYAELRFKAEKGKAYRLWMRGKAASNNWANDSVYVQFSGSVDGAGTPRWRIGTTSHTTVQIEQGVNAGLSGWGWADNGYDGDGPLVYFAATGDQVIRLQIREDGLSLDQIVLSAAKHLAHSPGLAKNDTTILALPEPDTLSDAPTEPAESEPAVASTTSLSASSDVPTSYAATTDRAAKPKPPLPAIGGAGFRFVDPTFGSRMLRVTDRLTFPGTPDRSYRTPSASHQNAWNTTSKYFYLVTTHGNVVPFTFDPATMTASRINPTTSGAGGLLLSFFGEPQFSYVEENLIYGAYNSGTLRTIRQYDFQTGAYTQLLDLDTLGASLTGTYVGGVMSSAGAAERILVWYGGTSQDRHFRVVVFERANPSRRRVLDTLASTIDGAPTSTVLNFKLHHVQIDRSGRYVLLSTTYADQQSPRKAHPEYVWDTVTDVITPLPLVAARAGGHNALGFGTMLNHDCCTSTTWDAAQWQFRSLASPLTTRDVVNPVLLPQEVYLSEHTSWHNVRSDGLAPFVTSLYRYGNNTAPWRAWDDEIVAVQSEATSSTTVWRFAHHRTNVANDANALQYTFWYLPRVNVSQDGRWAIFTSNWEKTLGIDAGVTSEYRQDVFALELAVAAPLGPPPNQPPSVAITAPADGAVFTAGAPVGLAASATDADGSVARVEFHVNGALAASDSAAPYSATWAPPSAGAYSLTATAVDSGGASSTSAAIAVSVVDPVAIVTSTLSGGLVGAAYTHSLQASGGLGSYTWAVANGSLPQGLALSAAGVLSGVPSAAGSWTFTLTVWDTTDASRSASRAFTLDIAAAPVNAVPTVSISAPADGARIPGGTTVAVTASASDADGSVARVDFYVNGVSIGSRLTEPYTVQWQPPTAGMFTLTARAADNLGAAATSAAVNVTVVAVGEVVLYAADAGTVVGKKYRLEADATAAGGNRLATAATKGRRVLQTQASPSDYVEFTFHAEAGLAYHLWVRGRAEANDTSSDSAYVQFSGTVSANGSPTFRIGTTAATVFELEAAARAGVSGWGWEDNASGGLAAPIYFAATGPQRIRLQPREDGLAIDQIVLSPARFLNDAPGAAKNDSTIVAK